ncbi:MAG: long-chain fatty acid--CoA ligase [Alphaproteobacteria bacterium]|nr:long-chain fatty acid--CoA ligase [Alphaproteobacteria bacterium]
MDGTMMDFPLTLTPMLERAGKLFGDVEIVTRLPDKSLHRHTFAEFHQRTRRLAAALEGAGLKRGERVATIMWNGYAHLEAYFAVPCSGGVLHTLNFRLHENDIAFIANHAEDRFLIVDDVLLPIFERIKDKVKFERVFVVPLSGAPIPEGLENYEDFLATGRADYAFPELKENEASGMCYTSGTTGRPKGVAYSHRAMVLHTFCVGLADTVGLTQRDVLMPVVPMFHANAWGLAHAAMMMGSKLAFPGPHMDAENILGLCESEQVTLAAGVPTIWIGILQALEADSGRWKLHPDLRSVVGGSALPEGMIRGFDRHGITTIHAWGMTEMTPIGTISRLKRGMEALSEDERYQARAKQGLAVPFVEMRVINDEGEAPWDGESMGELQVRGPWIASSYYNSEEGSDKWSADGWFGTGDVVTIDKEGYVKITDRTKDLIKSGGEWISSVDLENALMGHAGVREAAVIAVPHEKWTERPLAVVVAAEGAAPSAAELKEYLSQSFAKWWLPDNYEFVDEIPRTSTGKFLKTALREKFATRDWGA